MKGIVILVLFVILAIVAGVSSLQSHPAPRDANYSQIDCSNYVNECRYTP